jgi:hypothetical protein
MKKIFFAILLCFAVSSCYAQLQATWAIKKSFVLDQKLVSLAEFDKKSFLFLLTLQVNNDGNVDSVAHSDNELFDTRLVDLNKTIRKLTQDKKSFKEYKNQVLVICINLMHHDAERPSLTGLGSMYETLMKTVEKDKKVAYLESALIVI